MEQQRTIPMIVPRALEQVIRDVVPVRQYWKHHPFVPVHDPSQHDPQTAPLPPLFDTTSQSGNLRYWVTSKESVWAGQHPMLDELNQLLWCLRGWFSYAFVHEGLSGQEQRDVSRATDSDECLFWMIKCFRRRFGPYPWIPDANDNVHQKRGLSTSKEIALLRNFVASIL